MSSNELPSVVRPTLISGKWRTFRLPEAEEGQGQKPKNNWQAAAQTDGEAEGKP